MTVQVADDDMMGRFNVGDVVRFSVENGGELYSYKVPEKGTVGIIEVQTHSYGLEQMLGVQIPMSVVQWEDGQRVPVYSQDLKIVKENDEAIFKLVKKLKSKSPYSGESNN